MKNEMYCPKCGGELHFKADYPNDVSDGYVCACMHCDEDFYLIEVVK